MRLINLAGERFGKLTVIERNYVHNNNIRPYWNCVCDCCGKVGISDSVKLLSGKKTSCKGWKLDSGTAGLNMLFRNYKGGAKARSIEFNLSYDEFKLLTQQNCFYCGELPSFIAKKGKDKYMYNGIDRIDNQKGYIKNNVVACCGMCNNSKSTMTKEAFLTWVKKVYNFSIKQEDN